MFHRGKILLAALAFSPAGNAAADALVEASQGLCDSIKTCALSQIASQDLTPEIRAMMEPMLENMCAAMNSKVQEVPTSHGLYRPALACMRSMQALTCEQMQSQTSTPECQQYEALAREAAGIQ